MARGFMIALRGYDLRQVDEVIAQAREALASGSETSRASARAALEEVRFASRLRGYARAEVDQAVEHLLDQLRPPC